MTAWAGKITPPTQRRFRFRTFPSPVSSSHFCTHKCNSSFPHDRVSWSWRLLASLAEVPSPGRKKRARNHAQKMGSFFERPPRPARLGCYFFKSGRISFFPSEFVWARFLFSFVRFRVSATKISGTPFPNLLARRHLVSSKIVPLPESGCLEKVCPHGDHNRPQTDQRNTKKETPWTSEKTAAGLLKSGARAPKTGRYFLPGIRARFHARIPAS